MNENLAVRVDHVTMNFNMPKEKIAGVKEYFVKLMKRQLTYEKFTALSDVSLEVPKGEVLGIVGLNGSGKSTLLKVISGIMKPSEGSVEIAGTISPLIELGAGFDFELTPRENIYLNGSVLGFDRAFIKERYEDILDFSELREFENVAIKNFSSGMIARLGFSVATLVKPDILIVDEILAVGDLPFQKKCEARIHDLMSGGTTVLFVSHSIDQIERLCSRCVWLERGKLIHDGPASEICAAYRETYANG